MKSIKALIQELNVLRGTNEYKSLSLIDDHITSIENRINSLELRNMKYFCRVNRATAQTIATGTPTFINFTTTNYPQFGNMHDNTNNNDKVYIRRDGVYHLSAGVQWQGVAGGTHRQITICLIRGGVTLSLCSQREVDLGAAVNAHNAACSFYCYKDDYVSVQVTHNQGGPIDIEHNGEMSPFLAVSERMEDLDPSQYGLLNPEANTR